jgi:hypothetical protein
MVLRSRLTRSIVTTLLGVSSLLFLGSPFVAGAPVVSESARQIPVVQEVDVVVVGGSTGAVAAAVEAARTGAKVFLAAPRPYLGDDMTATLRLWLEEGETPSAPLAKQLFDDPSQLDRINHLGFSYKADVRTAERHKDSYPPSVLNDGRWGEPTHDSVQYDSDVNITADLQRPQEIAEVNVRLYHQPSSGGYAAESVTVFTSDDKKTWTQRAVIPNKPSARQGLYVQLQAPLGVKARYVKFFVKKAPKVSRLLLGEIEILAPASGKAPPKPWPRPMHVKKVLDTALLEAGVNFLYGCYATDVLRDEQGHPCGIVMANRAGRQAVMAKMIIDGTERATVARLAGIQVRPYPAGKQTFRRVVIGGEPRSDEGMTARVIAPAYRGPFPNQAGTPSGDFAIIEYTLQLPMADGSYTAWARADQFARSLTYHPEQQFTSDLLFQIPPDAMHGQETAAGKWQGVQTLPLGVFRPKGVERMLVLGGCADISRDQAEKLLRPLALIELGQRLGKTAAQEAQSLASPRGARLSGTKATAGVVPGEVRELLAGARPTQKSATVSQESRPLPVLGKYDVVIIGGGTAGAPAGIGAARRGAKTLVVEYLSGLGGVSTTGAISRYCSGNRVGFTAEIAGGADWIIEQRMEWYRSELEKAGADVWFGAIGCGALVQEKRVTGAIVVTPQGRGVVLADVVIDATGNADIAAAAGAQCVYTGSQELAMQGTGLPPRQLGATYTNTDYTYTDETDMVDVWQLLVTAKDRYATAFDLGQLVDTRERQQIVGDVTVTFLDIATRRTFPDTIVQAAASYDTHGYIVDPFLLLKHPMRRTLTCDVPYRALLPRGLEGILVAGIGMSFHRDAQPVVRMQPDIQNQGYAAGVAAAMAAKAGVSPRAIDVRTLQKHLVEIGNLEKRVLTDNDLFPLPPERVAKAVKAILTDYASVAIIMSHRQQAVPLVREAYASAEGEAKLAYAKVLGMMGDATGMETLVAELARATRWDEVPDWRIGPDYPRAAQVGWSMSNLDNTMVALGRSRCADAVPAMVEKLKLLGPRSSFSHYRAVCLALELTADPRAAQPLAELLSLPGIGGHAYTTMDAKKATSEPVMMSVREVAIARALYRCGDYHGLGEKTLRQYTDDLRGHFARHAQAVLNTGNASPAP